MFQVFAMHCVRDLRCYVKNRPSVNSIALRCAHPTLHYVHIVNRPLM